MKMIKMLCILALFMAPLTPCLAYNIKGYEHEETRELIRFVVEAVEEIEENGEAVFSQFREKDSRWLHDTSYIFVWGLDGVRYVYPPDPGGEGKNMLNLEDIDGKPIGKMFVEEAKSKTGEGWVHYRWPQPGGKIPVWKSTFIKRAKTPSGKIYLVGSGKYNMRCEKIFIVHMVNQAVSLLEKKELGALDIMRSRSSEFIFQNSYIFVKDDEGNELFNAAFPKLEGTNVLNLQDAEGKYFVQEVINTLRFEDDCWVEYMWPKPGKTEPSKKIAYEKKASIDGRILIVGAGYYPE